MEKPTLPAYLVRIIMPVLDLLCQWFSAHLYEKLIKNQPDHALVRLNELANFAPIAAKCAGFHAEEGPGKPKEHTISQLCRALYIKSHYSYSYRKAEEAIRNNLIVRWFVGYPLFGTTLDHTTLQRFENWVREHHQDLFLVEINRQILSSLPEERAKPVIGDTFAVNADAATKLLPELLRDSCRIILERIKLIDPQVYAQMIVGLDFDRLLGPEKEKPIVFLEEKERNELAIDTAREAFAFRKVLAQYKEQFAKFGPDTVNWLNEKIRLLDKIFSDEFAMTVDESGNLVKIKLLGDKQKGEYRIASAVDPEATYRVHGDKINFGYNPNVVASENFIWEIKNKTGAAPDPVGLPDIMVDFCEHYGFFPDKLIYDRAAGSGKIIASIKEVTDGGTRLVVKLIDNSKNSDRFSPQDFTLDESEEILTCPDGRTTTRKYLHGTKSGYTFRFTARMCAGCLLWTACRGEKGSLTGHRNVFISFYHADRKEALEYSKTPEFKKDYKLRGQIERVIAGLVLHNGARNARYRGTKKVEYQLQMAACAYNVKRWLKILSDKAVVIPVANV